MCHGTDKIHPEVQCPEMTPMSSCVSKTSVLALTGWPIPAKYLMWSRDCVHNEMRSLTGRVLVSSQVSNQHTLQMVQQEADRFATLIGTVAPLRLCEVVKMFPPKKQRVYLEAAQSLVSCPLMKKDEYISAFVKREKLPLLQKNNDPRMIQFRSRRYNLSLAVYTRAIEKRLYHVKDPMTNTPAFAKGLNQRQRAQQIVALWARYKRPTSLSLDLSRWDMNCNQDLLKVMHQVYLKCIPDDHLKTLLKVQLKNRGFTKNGIRYRREGGVMSGDMTTALGNCILVFVIQAAFRRKEKGSWAIMSDGDDHLIIGEAEEVTNLQLKMEKWFQELGHKMRVEGTTNQLNQVLFCQSKPLYHNGIWEMMPDPHKVLSSSFMVSSNAPFKKHYLEQVWLARAILHQGQPILGPLFKGLVRRGKLDQTIKLDLDNQEFARLNFLMRKDQRLRVELDVDEEAREQVTQMWEIDPTTQELLERMVIPPLPHGCPEVAYSQRNGLLEGDIK